MKKLDIIIIYLLENIIIIIIIKFLCNSWQDARKKRPVLEKSTFYIVRCVKNSSSFKLSELFFHFPLFRLHLAKLDSKCTSRATLADAFQSFQTLTPFNIGPNLHYFSGPNLQQSIISTTCICRATCSSYTSYNVFLHSPSSVNLH